MTKRSFFLTHVVLFLILFSFQSWAEVRVAFYQNRFKDGSFFSFEQGGKFFHIAIETREGWLHVDGKKGVTLEKRLPQFGNQVVILSVPEPMLDRSSYARYLGFKADHTFIWEDPFQTGKIYCSQLIAKVLQIPPLSGPTKPMNKNGQRLGVSPDDIYRILKPHANEISQPVF